MTEASPYLLGMVVGLVTGLYYFGGLWLTVKKVPRSRRPHRLLGISIAARGLPTLVIMFLALRRDPGIFFALLVAFFAVRFVMTGRIAGLRSSQPAECHRLREETGSRATQS